MLTSLHHMQPNEEVQMAEWTQTKTLQYGNCTITIHRPVLTAPERAKRERQVQDVLRRELRNYIFKEEKHDK